MSPADRHIGILVPSSNTIIESDARLLFPSSIAAHFARMKITRDDAEQLSRLLDLAPAAAELLADAAVEAIAFACTTGSLYGGPGYDARIIAAIQDATGISATTTATAVINSLRSAAAQRIALVTPYEPWLNEIVARFLEDNGLKVTARYGFGISDPLETAKVAPQEIAAVVERLSSSGVDAVLIACTAFRGVEASALLDDSLGIPIVSSNQATCRQLEQIIGADRLS